MSSIAKSLVPPASNRHVSDLILFGADIHTANQKKGIDDVLNTVVEVDGTVTPCTSLEVSHENKNCTRHSTQCPMYAPNL